MQDFLNKKILLGLCGGIAVYKSAYLVRELRRLGAEVRVVMTAAAQEFMTPLTFQALSGHAVRTELFDSQAEQAMGHIELARWADYLLVAPASANFLAKIANGIADDLLTTLYLVAEIPVILCPAMNKSMWSHPATQHNCEMLRGRNALLIGPEEGIQACGEEGLGRLSEFTTIIDALRLYRVNRLLAGQEVLITAGPTVEAIDAVRFLSNHSSGKMGYALAQAAHLAGAKVILISGPTCLTPPLGVETWFVNSAQAMLEAVMDQLRNKMVFIGAAAVADYYLADASLEKIKKQRHNKLRLELSLNPDILERVSASGKASCVVGFAAETSKLLEQARAKLARKKLDIIVANQVGEGVGFKNDGNQVTVVTKNSEEILPFMHKARLAGEIIAILARYLQNAGL